MLCISTNKKNTVFTFVYHHQLNQITIMKLQKTYHLQCQHNFTSG